LYGHSRETTPFLSEFAERATVYDQARASGTRSITGHASLFTGREVEEHGLTSADKRLRSGSTIFETLQQQGYETAVFSENVWITDVNVGLRNGFDTVVGPQNVPFTDALDARRFVAEEGRGNYGDFLRACLNDDRPLRSLANGAVIKLTSDYPWLYPFENSPPGDVYLDRFLDCTQNATALGVPVSTSWTPTAHTNRSRNTTDGVTRNSFRFRLTPRHLGAALPPGIAMEMVRHRVTIRRGDTANRRASKTARYEP
jgi:hypothetical protein